MLLLFELLGIKLRLNSATQEWETYLSRTVNTSIANAFFAQYVVTDTGAQLGRLVNVPTTPVEISLVFLAMKFDLAVTQGSSIPFSVSDSPIRFELASAMAVDELFLSYRKESSFEISDGAINKYRDVGQPAWASGNRRGTVRVKQDLGSIVFGGFNYTSSGRDRLVTGNHPIDSNLHITTTFGTGTEVRLLQDVATLLNVGVSSLRALLYPYLDLANVGGINSSVTFNYLGEGIGINGTLVNGLASRFAIFPIITSLHQGVDLKFPQYGVNYVKNLTKNVGVGNVNFPIFSDNIEGAAEFVVAQARLIRASNVLVFPPGVIRSSLWFGIYDGATGVLKSCWLSIPLLVEVQQKSFLATNAQGSMRFRPFNVGFGSPVRLVFSSGDSGGPVDLSGFVSTANLTSIIDPIKAAIAEFIPEADVVSLVNSLAPTYYGDRNGQRNQRRR